MAKKQCRVKGGEGLSNFKYNPKTIIDEQEGKEVFISYMKSLF
jgi:hypothetical protein